jgi:A/G-specific adenine glycosylase
MLQQTQVDRVAIKYPPFIHALPDFKALARAPLVKVLGLWQGLGYNRRALSLKRAAEIVVKQYKGNLPSSPEILAALPGIGKATAASIAAFAFNKPALFLETNIRAVLIHHFLHDKKFVTDDELLPFAEAVLDKNHPRKWYSALMDYGTMLKKQYGNAARRSVHYAKQSRFEGSRRQLRGKIIHLLLKSPSTGLSTILKNFPDDKNRARDVLRELEKEGIIAKTSGRYSISS